MSTFQLLKMRQKEKRENRFSLIFWHKNKGNPRKKQLKNSDDIGHISKFSFLMLTCLNVIGLCLYPKNRISSVGL
ncbi:hypothetical protein AZK53_08905 [Priestia megaterium]|nr:hypothetical protein AZK53_08905 [Priestia megaterium]